MELKISRSIGDGSYKPGIHYIIMFNYNKDTLIVSILVEDKINNLNEDLLWDLLRFPKICRVKSVYVKKWLRVRNRNKEDNRYKYKLNYINKINDILRFL